MKIQPKVLTGVLNSSNKGACDWGWQGMVAYGCQTFVVVIDPKTVQVIQVLSGHKAVVTKVRWAQESYYHDIASPYNLCLASADSSGIICVWDVNSASVKSEFTDGNRPVSDIQWVKGQDTCRDLLVALHHPYCFILWNAATGIRLWKKTYTEALFSMTFDPFDVNCLAFLGQECIVFINDFSLSKVPSSNGKKYYLSNTTGVPASNSSGNLSEKKSSMNLAKRVGQILIGGDIKPGGTREDDEVSLTNECLQLMFHPACRHHLILLYSREVLVLDLDINQTISIISMDRIGSPFVQVWPCTQRDALLCLQENGSVSLRVRRKNDDSSHLALDGSIAFADLLSQSSADISYDLCTQTDPMRVTKQSRVMAMSCSPVSEKSLVLVMSDSKVIFWDLRSPHTQMPMKVHTSSTPFLEDDSMFTMPTLIQKNTLNLSSTDFHVPKLVLPEVLDANLNNESLSMTNRKVPLGPKFLLTGLLNRVCANVSVIKMCPPLTNKNWNIYQPHLAVGSQSGVIQIFNLATDALHREYSVHTSPVKGIEWMSLHDLLSFSHHSPSNSSVRNELVSVNILTGRIRPFRTNKDMESPVDFLKCSQLKQYLIIVFKSQPAELWDLQSLTLLRELPSHTSHITTFEWAPSGSKVGMRSKIRMTSSDDSSSIFESPSEMKSPTKNLVREHSIFTENEGMVFNMVVEGNVIIELSKISSEPGMNKMTSMFWKADYIMFSDAEGHLNLWDLKKKKAKHLQTQRGCIRKIRMAPGRGNHRFAVLYTTGLEIWDTVTLQSLYRLRHQRDLPKILDVDWAASEQPVIVTEDGCIRVYNIKLTHSSAPVDLDVLSNVFSPHLFSPQISLTIKYHIQHQPFYKSYSLQCPEEMHQSNEFLETVNKQLSLIDKSLADYLLYPKWWTAERCLIAARLFGDENELHFWTVALHYLKIFQTRRKGKCETLKDSRDDNNSDLANLTVNLEKLIPPLERCYDILCDKDIYQKQQLEKLLLHDSKRISYEHTQSCIENCILLGQVDRAVHLLLETDTDHDNYYSDNLRACLAATVKSSGESQSTIKLVATNLIANAKLSEGIQLLCLIGKLADACRYLQTYSQWDKASLIAKAMLPHSDCLEVMKRWADHLCTAHVNLKNKAVLVMLSQGEFMKVIEMLYAMRYFNRAVCFVESCLEFGVIEKTLSSGPLFDAIFLEYARYLTTLGNRAAASYYCNMAGDKGCQFMKEIDMIFAENNVDTES